MGYLMILEVGPKILTSGTPQNWGYNIVSSTPSGNNAFLYYFVLFMHNLEFFINKSLQ